MWQLHRQMGAGPALAKLWMADPPGIFTGLRAHPEAYAALERIVAEHPFTELVDGGMRAISGAVHTREQLAGLRVPVTVVVGTADMPRFVENARLLAEAAADCTVHVVEGAGHLPLLEEPEVCAAMLGRVLAGAPANVAAAGA